MKLTGPNKVGITGIVFLAIDILLQTVIFPSILKSEVKKKVALKNGWPMRTAWSKLTFPLEMHWYIFNITNTAEVEKGGKPKVREVGPFVYDVWQEKINQEDHEEDDTLSYTLRNTYFFNPIKSGGLDDSDELMLPHLTMLGIPNGLLKDRPFLMPIASRAIDSLLKNPQSVFLRAKVRTLLFDGFLIECRGIEDFHGKVMCNDLHENYDSYLLVKVGELNYTNSLWGPFNGTDKAGKRLRIKRGIENILQLGKVQESNHKKNFSAWNADHCDSFLGSDFTIFPPLPNKKKKQSFFATHNVLCRNFKYTYDSTVHYKGLELLRYTTVVGVDGRNKPEEQCFCMNSNQCPPIGVLDLYKCLHVPLAISSPHFYQADPYLVRSLDGLKPVKEKHMMMIDIDPLTGYAVRINTRFQVNLNIMPLKKYRLMESFPDVLLPLAWFNEQTVLPYSYIKVIKACHRTVIISMHVCLCRIPSVQIKTREAAEHNNGAYAKEQRTNL
ncbi:sensory neuron membrane protein 1-like isoform X2 [Phymastichus coffea]|uniref:sensory neuron membrane protein 1-like isoform X2 n=1 Tax=Phymastichus coffea TaxID=108790 RepID=UPI00273A889F|nr:sensory neuron membrane protein 1-like isoform X2 [Phymastichus coffea]